MHSTLVRNLSILFFIGLIVMCVLALQDYRGLPEDQQADGIIKLVLYFIGTAIVGGLLFVFYVLPIFGDAMGEAMLSSSEEAGTDPYLKARGKIAIGDYEGAVAEFRQIARENPKDRMPITEIVKLYLERLHDPANAELVLENAIRDPHWGADDASWFIFKLVDLVQTHQSDDKDRVINLLQKVMRRYPESRHSANAIHRLREIDPQLVATVQAEISAERKTATASPAEGEEEGAAVDGEVRAPTVRAPDVGAPAREPDVPRPRAEPPKPNV